MARLTYLERHTKNQGYWFRRGIPVALRPVLQKGTVWRENLHTKERNEARLRAHAVAAQVEAEFQQARIKLLKATVASEAVPNPDPAFLTGLLSAWKEQERYRRARAVLADTHGDQETFDAECRLAGACGVELKGFTPESDDNIEAVCAKVRDLLQVCGLPLTPKHAAFHMLSQRLSELWVEVLEEEHKWREYDLRSLPTVEPAPIPVMQPPQRHGGELSLMEVHARFVAERNLSPSIQREHRTAFGRLRGVLGGDVPIRTVTKAHVVELKTLMFLVPRKRKSADAGLPLPQLVDAYKNQVVERLDQGTVVKTMGLVHTFFGWAHENGYIATNVAANTVPRKRAGDGRSRKKPLPYTPDDLRALFGSPLFTGCSSSLHTFRPGSVRVRDHRYWLPILALHTGCRLEELGQLHRTDLKSQDGIWYLEITTTTETEDGPAKRLKTRNSQRIVPLHPALIRLGFIDYVKGLEGPSRRIFPCLEPTPDGRLTQSYSKVFGRYCNQIGLRDRRKVFHSFRHLFKDRCRDARIPEEVHDALTGHSSGGEGRRYGAGVPLGVLHGAVSELVFEGFPL